MCSSGTSSPVSADTFFMRMRLIERSSSWLKDTFFLLTAWNSLTGIVTSPKLIVPLQTGRGMAPFCPSSCARETRAAAPAGQARTARATRSVPNAVRMAR